jgi:hypothetical protein
VCEDGIWKIGANMKVMSGWWENPRIRWSFLLMIFVVKKSTDED